MAAKAKVDAKYNEYVEMAVKVQVKSLYVPQNSNKLINVEVFNDTKKKCKTNVKLINSYNPPEIVAQAAKNVLKDYKHVFKNIEFAIYTTKYENNFMAIFPFAASL